jgi:hypothetical protein
MKPLILHLSLLLSVLVVAPTTTAQTTQPLGQEDSMAPEEFTAILKEAWGFLFDETDSLVKAIEKKGEFETTPEFERRVADRRRQYIMRTQRYAQEKKFNERIFGVLLKAKLVSYDADAQVYLVRCDTTIEAPYNVPTVRTMIPSNPYVALNDTIIAGYRTSTIFLKFKPFRWQIARDAARAAKADEAELFFKVRFRIEMAQNAFKSEATFSILPVHIMLLNTRTNTIYWEQKLL